MNFQNNTLSLGKKLMSAEVRCECRQLLAKLREANLEIKCKRCKRIVTISYNRLKEHEITIAPCAP